MDLLFSNEKFLLRAAGVKPNSLAICSINSAFRLRIATEGERLRSNGLLSWSVRTSTCESDWNPTPLLKLKGKFNQRQFASHSPEGEELAAKLSHLIG